MNEKKKKKTTASPAAKLNTSKREERCRKTKGLKIKCTPMLVFKITIRLFHKS